MPGVFIGANVATQDYDVAVAVQFATQLLSRGAFMVVAGHPRLLKHRFQAAHVAMLSPGCGAQ